MNVKPKVTSFAFVANQISPPIGRFPRQTHQVAPVLDASWLAGNAVAELMNNADAKKICATKRNVKVHRLKMVAIVILVTKV